MLMFFQHCPYIKNSRQIYMYKYTSIHMYTRTHTHTHIYIYIFLNTYIYIYIELLLLLLLLLFLFTYIITYLYIFIFIHAYYGYGWRTPTRQALLDLISVSARISSNADTTEAPLKSVEPQVGRVVFLGGGIATMENMEKTWKKTE